MHRRFTYSWLIETLRERGLVSSIAESERFLTKLLRLWWWDWKHNVSTRTRVETSALGLSGPSSDDSTHYEACDSMVLPALLRRLNIQYGDYVFIDLGAGKGQALFHAAEFPFRRVVGLELSPSLCAIARSNCKTFRSRTQACREIELICGDAAAFIFPEAPLVIYLFNPFGETVLSQVLTNLLRSIDDCVRDMFIVYQNPKQRHVIERSQRFDRLITGTDETDYRKLQYDVYRFRSPH